MYPEVVIKALGSLYNEYNHAFKALVNMNREWTTDYQYCTLSDTPLNYCVQVDMVGCSSTFLEEACHMSKEEVREILRGKIFEIENSLAMYQLLAKLFCRDEKSSFFEINFRAVLDDLRRRFNKPIALLAVTKHKYDAMLESEFGYSVDGQPTNDKVKELSGFDTFFGPEQFRQHLKDNNGECGYLLYVRSSDPVGKLKDPSFIVEHPLLDDKDMRRVIKANALTFNVDAPEMEYVKRINDTKSYMAPMGMAFEITSMDDLYSSEFNAYLGRHGLDSKTAILRCKPAKGTYGCYGHLRGILTERKFRGELKQNLSNRKCYVIQPEVETPVVTNKIGGITYTFIDRNFFGVIGEKLEFLGGFRNLIPVDTQEARMGRIHGNRSAVYAEITG